MLDITERRKRNAARMRKWCAENREKKHAMDAEYRAKNREKFLAYWKSYYETNSDKIRERASKWFEKNRELCKQRSRDRYDKNKESILELAKQRAKKPEVIKSRSARRRFKYHSVPCVKIAIRCRSRLARVLKKELRSENAIQLLGCSLEDAVKHIESLFKPGMSWSNWNYNGWHLDHIKPLVSFDLTDPEQLKVACHISNLQPLWKNENLSKSRKTQP